MEDVRQDTAGLLSIDSASDKETFYVGFSHRTFAIYVNTNEPFPNANQRMFDACLSYLGLDTFRKPITTSSQLEETLKDYPFASYAACYWGLHASKVKQTARNCVRILELLDDTEQFNCVMKIAWRTLSNDRSTWDVSGGITPLHASAFYGLEILCSALISASPSVDPVEEAFYQTPLIYACRQGHVEVARVLLNAGADPNHLTKLGKIPLLEAIEVDNQDIFDLLMAQDHLDVNLRGTSKSDPTPLIATAKYGRESMMAKLLNRDDIFVNKADGWNCTALIRAVQNLQIGSARQLLDHEDTDLTLRDTEDNRTALDWLAGNSPGLDYEQDSDDIHTLAAMLMADRRAPHPSDQAIIMAIELGKHELLRIFVEGSLHHLYTDEFGRNFLHLAATEGVCAIVTLFHDRLAKELSFNIDALDMYKSTALHAACSRLADVSDVETIKFLLDAGADPTLKDDQGLDPSMRARRASQDLWNSDVKALFASRHSVFPDVDSPPATLKMALQTAKIDVFEAALDQLPSPLDPGIAQYSKSTILHHAIRLSSDFRREVLSLLLPRSKAFLSDLDDYGQTCAHLAVKQSSLETLELLCDAGIDMDHRDKWGQTPFVLAQQSQRLELCVFLATRGAVLPPCNEIRPDVLQAAIESGELSAVQRLVDAGVDINFRDAVTGHTNIQLAEKLKQEAVQLANDELWRTHPRSATADVATWQSRIDNTPEVVKRDAILQFLQKTQERSALPHAPPREPDRGLTDLLAKLKGMYPNKVLSISDVVDEPVEIVPVKRVMSMQQNLAAKSLTLNVGAGVVVIVVTIVVGIAAVAIAWILARR